MTSNKSILIGGTGYDCIRLDYTSKKEQYYTLSYLDKNAFKIEKGGSYNILGFNGLYDLSNYMGHCARLNTFYRFYEIRQILFQGGSFKTAIEFSSPAPASILCAAKNSIDLDIIEESGKMGLEKYEKDHYSEKMNDILITENSDLFRIVKKNGIELDYEN